jgi:hypothetical protein
MSLTLSKAEKAHISSTTEACSTIRLMFGKWSDACKKSSMMNQG